MNMEKKKYFKPSMTIVELKARHQLLIGSDPDPKETHDLYSDRDEL